MERPRGRVLQERESLAHGDAARDGLRRGHQEGPHRDLGEHVWQRSLVHDDAGPHECHDGVADLSRSRGARVALGVRQADGCGPAKARLRSGGKVIFYFASGNAHKVEELRSLARSSGLSIAIHSARDVGGMPTVVEDAGTFSGNARKKALAFRSRVPADAWVLADDSGLCVDALNGAPGVESAYYAGPQGDGAANLSKLIETLREFPDAQRSAQFRCVLLAIGSLGEERTFEGMCSGRLLKVPRGGGGFGYDPLFVPDGYHQSFSELGDDVKNRIGHRARAWARLAEWVRETEGARV